MMDEKKYINYNKGKYVVVYILLFGGIINTLVKLVMAQSEMSILRGI